MSGLLADRIRRDGPLPFADFMAAALYHPRFGYYARGHRQVGRGGDFFTSVSAGPLFGRLLARHALAFWEDLGRPGAWRLLELGAHTGQLAGDLLEEISRLQPSAASSLTYAVVEPLENLAAIQRANLARFPRVTWAAAPAELDPAPTLLLANEVLDALPCEIIESDGNAWRRLGVGLAADGASFAWHDLGPAGIWADSVPPRPAGYRTEIRPGLDDFLAPLARLLEPGRMLWFDYGFAREDYYDALRTSGTLRTFGRHRAGEDPLDGPGGRDITAHVDFTALEESVARLGGRILRFDNQSRFLTRLARPWLLELEGRTDAETLKLLRNFQTLTHPGQLGSRFHAFEAGFPAALSPSSAATP